jgi:hypothetical protein
VASALACPELANAPTQKNSCFIMLITSQLIILEVGLKSIRKQVEGLRVAEGPQPSATDTEVANSHNPRYHRREMSDLEAVVQLSVDEFRGISRAAVPGQSLRAPMRQ